MKLAFGLLFLWIGGACLFLASHGMQAATPWEAWGTILGKFEEVGSAAAQASA